MGSLRLQVGENEVRCGSVVRTLVVDGLNFLGDFVPCHGTVASRLKRCDQRVKAFHRILASSGIDCIWVFDCGQHTPESNSKWVQRRMQEVAQERRNMIAYAETYLMAELQRVGCTVLSPPEIDGDDAIAWIARDTGGHILSRDNDMVRYGLPLDRILNGLEFQYNRKGGIGSIILRMRSKARSVSPRELPGEPFDAELQELWTAKEGSLVRNIKSGLLRRGNSDAYTKQWGNLHRLARPLRQALYARLGVESVTEILPTWNCDSKQAELEEEEVFASEPDGGPCCTSPDELYNWFRYNAPGAHDNTRQHAMKFIVAELVDACLPATTSTTSHMRTVDIYRQF